MPVPPHYPAFLNLVGKRVLVVGGGPVAAAKAKALALSGARVTLVAPRVSPVAKKQAERVLERGFQAKDLSGAKLVISASDDETVNARVSALCRRRGIWANVVDRAALCDFILPAVARRGRIVLGVSTGGASPALARFLRRRLERLLTPRDARLARTLARLRPLLLAMDIRERRRVIARMLSA